MNPDLLSLGYRATRRAVITAHYFWQSLRRQPRDLEAAVETGDWLICHSPPALTRFDIPEGLEVEVYGIRFPSPLTLAAFKSELPVIACWLNLGLGRATPKTVMAEERKGHERPRLQEINGGGLLNAMGLPGKSIEDRIAELERSPIFSCRRPIGISIGGSSIQEYTSNFDKLHKALGNHPSQPFYYWEINISCPNTPEGQQMQKHPELLHELIGYLREQTAVPIFIKLSPDMNNSDIIAFAYLINTYEQVGLTLGNTRYRKCEDVGLPTDAISVGGGGESGPALYPRTREMVRLIRDRRDLSDIEIIATGGIETAQQVNELLQNGASLVGLATGIVKDMYIVPRINRQLAAMR